MSFELHPRLDQDCFRVCDLTLTRVLLMNDARYPWCILVPREPHLRELHDLPSTMRERLFTEIELVSVALQNLFTTEKINVAALGNQVPQLHIHVIARHSQDAAWPNPVWGAGAPEPYGDAAAAVRIDELLGALAD